MEFSEKLKELRIKSNLTQEQLAEKLYVSRTAISKWESGRGYPNIDSLKEISAFFAVSLDDLLSSEEKFTVAKEESRKKISHLKDKVFGILDVAIILLLFTPLFGQKIENEVISVSLLSLSGFPIYLTVPYYMLVGITAFVGVLTLILQNCTASPWLKLKYKLSVSLSLFAVTLFLLSQQPYAGIFALFCVIIKALTLIKWE